MTEVVNVTANIESTEETKTVLKITGASKALAKKFGIPIRVARSQWEAITAFIQENLDEGTKVYLPGVGTLARVDIPAHTAKNPSTGEAVDVPPRYKYTLTSKPRNVE